ncbi:peptidase, M48 family [Nitrosococcus oceani AFC27]|nr:M56 family metallopeptidase [Nitrosococcus oceani]EDZ66164.1 peptidase, M48 family [Nitrosococcus oceani AFC27]KFI20773.1 peptidase M48 [Nitrosococcus oceani C-27]GEM20577.1 peptidase M48 [Nitrosococcus oceani]
MRVLMEVFPFAFVAWCGFAMITALFCALLYPWVCPRLLLLPPALRANQALVWAVAPAAAGVLLTGFIFLPPVLSYLGVAPDHCQPAGVDFSYHCLLHPFAVMERDLPWFLLLPLSGLALFFLSRMVWELLRAHRLIRALSLAGSPDIFRGIWVVESEWPLALTSGFSQPRIFISTKLLRDLSPPQLAAVLAHERAHFYRYDPARYFIARAAAGLHISWLRRKLLEDLSLAAEQACDEEAARQVGDRLLVADTIVQVERWCCRQRRSAPVPLPSFMGSQVVARVEFLLASPQKAQWSYPRMLGVCTGVALSGLLLAAEPLHQLTEIILGFLAR